MKVSLRTPNFIEEEDIDFEKTDLEVGEYELLKKDIDISNLSMFENANGLIGLSFESETHKYLNIEGLGLKSWDDNVAEGEEPSEFSSRTINVSSTYKVFSKSLDFVIPVFNFEITLTPETEEERRLTSAWQICVGSFKYAWSILFFPANAFGSEEDEEEEEEMKVEFEKIYQFGMED